MSPVITLWTYAIRVLDYSKDHYCITFHVNQIIFTVALIIYKLNFYKVKNSNTIIIVSNFYYLHRYIVYSRLVLLPSDRSRRVHK